MNVFKNKTGEDQTNGICAHGYEISNPEFLLRLLNMPNVKTDDVFSIRSLHRNGKWIGWMESKCN